MSSSQVTENSNDSAFDLLGRSADIVMKYWKYFALVNIFALISGVYNSLTYNQPKNDNYFSTLSSDQIKALLGLGLIVLLVFVFVYIFLYTMSISLQLRTAKGQDPKLNQIFRDGSQYWWRMLILTTLQTAIVVIGFILLIVPGIIAISRVVMAPYLMVDRGISSPWEAIKQSNQLAKGNIGRIWAVIGVTILVTIGSFLLSLIPFLGPILAEIFVILFSVIFALRYLQLKLHKT
jgi:uncharacterized membrane protein